MTVAEDGAGHAREQAAHAVRPLTERLAALAATDRANETERGDEQRERDGEADEHGDHVRHSTTDGGLAPVREAILTARTNRNPSDPMS